MPPSRRAVIAALCLAVAAINLMILSGLLATLFFSLTVVYVLEPLFLWLHRRGFSRWMASAISTTVAAVAVLVVVLPVVVAVYLRRGRVATVLDTIPAHITVHVAGFSQTFSTSDLGDSATEFLSEAAIDVAAAAPVLGAKVVVFAFVVFAVLVRREELAGALLGLVPDEYNGIAVDLHERVRRTLLALYITQAATALGTFLVALPVFFLFGYESFVVLAVAAGVLQFLPVIGPSVVVIGLAAIEVLQGSIPQALLLLVVGLVLVGFLPDALIRPQLARRTANLPASLYFVGFTGGILSLGAIGIIAGPLAVALLAETITLLGAEVHPDRAREV